MRFIGNVLWFVFGGFVSGLSWIVTGLLWCVTVVGIPVGLQCFKFARLAFCPFGKAIRPGGGPFSLLANIVWLCVSGLPMAAENALIGCLWCLTVVGIPFGKQFFKLARLSLAPFGSSVR